MRNVKLFRVEPRDRDADWSPARACAFATDPRSLSPDPSSEIVSISVPADSLASMRRSGSDGYMVPAALAKSPTTADEATLERFVALKDAYDDARAVRRSMMLSTIDCAIPGEMSPVARILWRHVPEVASRVGVAIGADEGGPVLQHMERDLAQARPVASYLACREDAQFLRETCEGVSTAAGIMRDVAGLSKPESSRAAVMASRSAAAMAASR